MIFYVSFSLQLFAVRVWIEEFPTKNCRVIKTTCTCVCVCEQQQQQQRTQRTKEANKGRSTATQPLLLRRRTAHVSKNKLRSTFTFVVRKRLRRSSSSSSAFWCSAHASTTSQLNAKNAQKQKINKIGKFPLALSEILQRT